MNQVDFYLLSNQVTDGHFKLTSRLCNKLHRLDKSVLVLVNSDEQANALDEVMWGFSDTSFLPHTLSNNDNHTEHNKIVITNNSGQLAASKADVLVNLQDQIPNEHKHFPRIAEIVAPDEPAKQLARQRFKQYRDFGYQLEMHNIEI